jgi:hypothetical protein
MTPDLLSSLAGLLLSLAASYLPGFSPWYATLTPDRKRLVMLAALVIIAAGLSLAPLFPPDLAGKAAPWLTILKAFLAALIANQSAYAITPRPRCLL